MQMDRWDVHEGVQHCKRKVARGQGSRRAAGAVPVSVGMGVFLVVGVKA